MLVFGVVSLVLVWTVVTKQQEASINENDRQVEVEYNAGSGVDGLDSKDVPDENLDKPNIKVSFEKSELIIKSDGKNNVFDIEVAKSAEQLAHGLMYRKSLEKDSGMLFIFAKPQIVNMWMKNTYVPLDMIFIDKNYKIVKIAKNNQPRSLDVISSGVDVIAVLEVNAMIADEKSIKVGDIISYSGFNNVD